MKFPRVNRIVEGVVGIVGGFIIGAALAGLATIVVLYARAITPRKKRRTG